MATTEKPIALQTDYQKSVASFEASNATSCGSSCNNTEKNTFKDSVVRYSATVETTAKKYKAE